MNIELKPIAESKVRQLGGDVCGVLVKNEAGAWAAVSEGGRVMRLDDFEGQPSSAQPEQPGDGVVPARDDLIQCLLATQAQSEGVMADAILSMLTTPQPEGDGWVPKGWKLVPVESTSEMDISAMDSLHNSYEGYVIDRDAAETIWSAMLAAAPQPPQEGE